MIATRTLRLLSVQPVRDGGGSEHALIAMIRQLVGAGWDCHVALPGAARLADEYGAAGAQVHIVPMARLTTSGGWSRWVAFALSWPVTVLRLAWLARRLRVDVIHSNSLHSWYGWAAAIVVRRPHVWHAREIVVQSPAALRVERWLARRFAIRVLAISHAVGAQLDPRNVEVVVDEADPEVFFAGRAGRFRARVGIAEDVVLVGSVARIDVWKGFDVLLDAFPTLRARRPGVELVIAGAPVGGKDEYAAALARRACQLPGVHWLGPRSDVPDLMADLDVFVQVSTEPEPFGLVLVEALASGVPVVAGDAGGPPEILGGLGPEAGRLVAGGDSAALAEAVAAVLPDGPSSIARRSAREALRPTGEGRFPAIFAEVAGGGRRA
ncbi:MAG: glycosyltransferase family 4 protein [Acidimicrobiales bacterium]